MSNSEYPNRFKLPALENPLPFPNMLLGDWSEPFSDPEALLSDRANSGISIESFRFLSKREEFTGSDSDRVDDLRRLSSLSVAQRDGSFEKTRVSLSLSFL